MTLMHSARDVVRALVCPCFARPGTPCGVLGLKYFPDPPEHDHVWRWARALKEGLITEAQYEAALSLSDGHRVFTSPR